MSRIARYVLIQHLLTFAVTLAGMSLVMVFSIMAKEAVRQGLGIEAILRLLPYTLPFALRFAVPASMLMATCSVFGRMAADNEVVATKSLGISPTLLLRPAFVLAIGISAALIWINDVAVTWGAEGMQTVIAESVESVVFRLLKTERSFQNDNLKINVKQVRGRKLIELRLEMEGIVLVAREAELRTNLKEQTLSIVLTDCTVETDGNTYVDSGTCATNIPLSKATRRDRHDPRISELGLGQISNEVVGQQATIRNMEQQLAARAALQMVTGDFGQLATTARQPDGRTWSALHQEYRDATSRLNRLKLEPWRRYAEGFSCLCVVLVGAPLAIKMRTSNFFTTFAMCFFPVLCLYYPIIQWAITQAKDGLVPPYTVWLGNGVLLLVGSWLIRRVVQH